METQPIVHFLIRELRVPSYEVLQSQREINTDDFSVFSKTFMDVELPAVLM